MWAFRRRSRAGVDLSVNPDLKTFPVWWKITVVNAVKVDETHRIQVSVLRPGDYYEPEVLGENEVLLRKVELPRRRPTFAEAMAAIESSPLRFTKSWDEIKKETR
jgi:hypothetical protein